MEAKTQAETIHFRIPSDPMYVPTLRRAILSLAKSLDFPQQTAEDIHVSVAEAITNAVEHGSPGQKADGVVVDCRVADGSLTIDVYDEGTGFDMPDSGVFEASLDEHGRGLRLIYNLMDNVKVRRTSKGAHIRMVKKKPIVGVSRVAPGQPGSSS